MALAIKHAVVNRDVAHLIFPDQVQTLDGLDKPPDKPKQGRISTTTITPPEAQIAEAVTLLEKSERPVIIVGNGARPHRAAVIALAEHLDAPIITTFKAKGVVPDDHPLACGVLGRSGIPVASSMMGHSDCLLVLGASFSNHTGISKNKPTIQVDFDRMMLGKFHEVDVPLWGDIGTTVDVFMNRVAPTSRPDQVAQIASRWAEWRTEKAKRETWTDDVGRMHPAALFGAMSRLCPTDTVLPVDVGNNTYAFGHYYETRGIQDVIMSGYLGSIGFAFPAALGAWAALGSDRKIVSISGDGGFGQYMGDFTTAVKYGMNITHVLLRNDELGKITREQVNALRPVWQTGLVNPDFAEFARLCGGTGFTVSDPKDLDAVLREAMAVTGGPSLVEVEVGATFV